MQGREVGGRQGNRSLYTRFFRFSGIPCFVGVNFKNCFYFVFQRQFLSKGFAMKKKILISDIARQLGISITTVSFILNGKSKEKRISEHLTKKVLKLVEEVGYRPNQLAQSLRTGKTKTIGLMVESISNTFFSNVARLIEENAYKRGYKIMYCSTENNPVKTRELIRMFRDKHVDGYIITPPEGIEENIQTLINDRFPVVLFDRYFPSIQTNYVIVDNFEGTYRAIQHFMQHGEEHIAFITLESGQTQMKDRLSGYRKAMKEQDKEEHVLKIPYDHDPEQMILCIVSFLQENRDLDAIFFATNYLAIRGLEAMDRLNLSIPSDIRVVSYDDHDLFRLYKPSITAVAQPIEEISEQVINTLLHHLDREDKNPPKDQLILSTHLIVRESSVRV